MKEEKITLCIQFVYSFYTVCITHGIQQSHVHRAQHAIAITIEA